MKLKRNLNWNLVFLALLAVVALGVFVWIQIDRTGEIRGVVEYPDGTPAAGATVRLREKTLNLIKEGVTATTDAEGRFTFTDQEIIEFFLDAQGPAGRRAPERRYHLYFAGQDFAIPEPLVLSEAAE
mgnify:CR=1 FL=1